MSYTQVEANFTQESSHTEYEYSPYKEESQGYYMEVKFSLQTEFRAKTILGNPYP